MMNHNFNLPHRAKLPQKSSVQSWSSDQPSSPQRLYSSHNEEHWAPCGTVGGFHVHNKTSQRRSLHSAGRISGWCSRCLYITFLVCTPRSISLMPHMSPGRASSPHRPPEMEMLIILFIFPFLFLLLLVWMMIFVVPFQWTQSHWDLRGSLCGRRWHQHWEYLHLREVDHREFHDRSLHSQKYNNSIWKRRKNKLQLIPNQDFNVNIFYRYNTPISFTFGNL